MHGHLSNGESMTTVVDLVGSGAQDEDWMPRAGREGYVIVTGDFDARFSPNIRRAVLEHECAVFTVRSARADDMARFVVDAMPTMRRVLRAHALAVIGRIIPGKGAILLHTARSEHLASKKTIKRPKGS